jgi:hypothetical protein
VSPKFGLSEAALVDEAGALSETELLCAHAIRAHAQSTISRHFATFMFSAAAPDQIRHGQLENLLHRRG